ncbi:MAG: hypothetical protein AB2L09_08455 [Coriobacteriia bacterium]
MAGSPFGVPGRASVVIGGVGVVLAGLALVAALVLSRGNRAYTASLVWSLPVSAFAASGTLIGFIASMGSNNVWAYLVCLVLGAAVWSSQWPVWAPDDTGMVSR